jgi:hypothetical protein
MEEPVHSKIAIESERQDQSGRGDAAVARIRPRETD